MSEQYHAEKASGPDNKWLVTDQETGKTRPVFCGADDNSAEAAIALVVDLLTAPSKVTEAQKAAERAETIKAECRARILEIAPQQAQANLAQAMTAYTATILRGGDPDEAEAVSGLVNEDFTTAKAAVMWRKNMVEASRAAILSGDAPAWPEVPAGVAQLMRKM